MVVGGGAGGEELTDTRGKVFGAGTLHVLPVPRNLFYPVGWCSLSARESPNPQGKPSSVQLWHAVFGRIASPYCSTTCRFCATPKVDHIPAAFVTREQAAGRHGVIGLGELRAHIQNHAVPGY
jgi:hypothetical protein